MKEPINNFQVWLDMFERTMSEGEVLNPRGHEIREVRDLQITLNPIKPFMAFVDRAYNVAYFKREMRWKLGANKYDTSIEDHAKMWATVKNPDGTYNSNYGQYWFGPQGGLWTVICELVKDHDTRRAVIPMLNASHQTPQTIDMVCTEAVGFHIRNNELNMSIHMRSSDQIFGLGTDIPTFAILYRLVYAMVKGPIPELKHGSMTITAMSSHIYSRHYNMVENILKAGTFMIEEVEMPICESSAEALYIVACKGKHRAVWDWPLASWLAE